MRQDNNGVLFIKLTLVMLVIGLPAGFAQALSGTASSPVVIQDFSFKSAPHQTVIVISADRLFDYTSYYPNPHLFIVDIPSAQSKLEKNFIQLKTSLVDFITISQIGEGQKYLVRTEFNLSQPVQYSLQSEGSKLRLVFNALKQPETKESAQQSRDREGAASKDPSAARSDEVKKQTPIALTPPSESKAQTLINDITIQEDQEQLQFSLLTTAKPLFKHFELKGPDRLVIDVDNSIFKSSRQAVKVNSDLIRRIRFGAGDSNEGKLVRCVFDLARKTPYEIIGTDSGLIIRFQKGKSQDSLLLAKNKVRTDGTNLRADENSREKFPELSPSPILSLESKSPVSSLLTANQEIVMPRPMAALIPPPMIEGPGSLAQIELHHKPSDGGVFKGSLNVPEPLLAVAFTFYPEFQVTEEPADAGALQAIANSPKESIDLLLRAGQEQSLPLPALSEAARPESKEKGAVPPHLLDFVKAEPPEAGLNTLPKGLKTSTVAQLIAAVPALAVQSPQPKQVPTALQPMSPPPATKTPGSPLPTTKPPASSPPATTPVQPQPVPEVRQQPPDKPPLVVNSVPPAATVQPPRAQQPNHSRDSLPTQAQTLSQATQPELRKKEPVPSHLLDFVKAEPPTAGIAELPQGPKNIPVAQLVAPLPALAAQSTPLEQTASVMQRPASPPTVTAPVMQQPASPPPATTPAVQQPALVQPQPVPVVTQQTPPQSPPGVSTPPPTAPVPPVQVQQSANPVVSSAGLSPTPRYSGEPVSLELKDADIKDFFRLIGEISGLNIVLDPDVKGGLSVFLNDVPWDQALDVVLKNNSFGKQLEGNVLRVASNTTLQAEEEQRKRLADARVLAAELQTETRILSYAKAAELSVILKKILSPRGDIIVDPRTNSMIISDIPGKFPAIDALIRQLDKKIKQVEIEARVIATTRDFLRDIGVQFGIIVGNNAQNKLAGAVPGNPFTRNPPPSVTIQPGQSGGAQNSLPLNVNLGAATPTSAVSFFGGFTNNVILDAIVSAAERRGTARLLSRPKIITQDNIEGFVQQGVKIPVQTIVNNTVSTQFFDFALKLKVTPQITEEQTIMLKVDIENSTPDFSRAVNNIPSVNTQQTITTVLVNNGGTVVIGGVLIDNEQRNIRQVPGIGSVPVIGNLFKNRSVNKVTQELVFFLSPKIL